MKAAQKRSTRSTAAKRNGNASWKGIPAKTRAAVRIYMAAKGWKSPQRAYNKLQLEAVVDGKAKAEQQRKVAEKRKRERRVSARNAIDPAIRKLASLRDFLELWERKGDPIGIGEQDCATFARVALVDAAANLERALFDLGLVHGIDMADYTEGWFCEQLAARPAPQQEARHAS